jgi:hypothetical protein
MHSAEFDRRARAHPNLNPRRCASQEKKALALAVAVQGLSRL